MTDYITLEGGPNTRTESKVKPEDKQIVLSWMMKVCLGFRQARTRANILPYLNLEDRYFRHICSELIHEGHIASSCQRGYWFIPLVTRDVAEIDAVFESCQERSSKALDVLRGLGQQIDSLTARREALTKQYVFTTMEVLEKK